MKLAAVVDLLFWSRPAAIGRGIPLVVVDAVERHSCGWLAHVGKKIQEIIPPFANGYASTSPISKAFVLRVGASLLHGVPSPVSGRGFGRMPVDEIEIAAKASATRCLSLLQIAFGGLFFGPAIAANEPIASTHKRENRPTTEAQTGRHAVFIACMLPQ